MSSAVAHGGGREIQGGRRAPEWWTAAQPPRPPDAEEEETTTVAPCCAAEDSCRPWDANASEEGRGRVGLGQRCFHPTSAPPTLSRTASTATTGVRRCRCRGPWRPFGRPLLALAVELRVWVVVWVTFSGSIGSWISVATLNAACTAGAVRSIQLSIYSVQSVDGSGAVRLLLP
jgi:hypothetical protein